MNTTRPMPRALPEPVKRPVKRNVPSAEVLGSDPLPLNEPSWPTVTCSKNIAVTAPL